MKFQKITNSILEIAPVFLVLSTLFFTGCSLEEPGQSSSQMTIEQDIQQALQIKKDEQATKWSGDTHKNIVQMACLQLGLTNPTLWNNANKPDSFTGPDDEGYRDNLFNADYPGKPGHAYFWEKDGSTWKHVKPGTSYVLFGDQHWADHNTTKWLIEARKHFEANTNNHDVILSYVLHYVTDMGNPYHVFWNGKLNSAIEQAMNHSTYEKAIKSHWAAGKQFQKYVGGSVYMPVLFEQRPPSNFIKTLSLAVARNYGYDLVETIGWGNPDFNNSKVFQSTVEALNLSSKGAMTMLLWAARNYGVLRSMNMKAGVLNTAGKQISIDLQATAGDKIYCAANWRSAYGGDMDVRIYRLSASGNTNVAVAATRTRNPETLNYIAPTAATYRIVAYAYQPSNTVVGLNGVVIKKKNNTYIFD